MGVDEKIRDNPIFGEWNVLLWDNVTYDSFLTVTRGVLVAEFWYSQVSDLDLHGPAPRERLAEVASDPAHPVRRWARAPLVDCSISFLVIVAFSAVFVASGTLILGPHHKIPDEANLLNLQSVFVTGIHPWLLPL